MLNIFKNYATITIMMISVLLPIKVYSQTTQSLRIEANRCRYYYIRSRSGDHITRSLLFYREGDMINMTGLNNCINVINNYLQETNINPEEKQVYENVKNNLSAWRNQIRN